MPTLMPHQQSFPQLYFPYIKQVLQDPAPNKPRSFYYRKSKELITAKQVLIKGVNKYLSQQGSVALEM